MPSESDIWRMYQQGKQTVSELAALLNVSISTAKRRLRNVSIEWVQPRLSGGSFVHIDATYWGRNNGILLAIDSQTSAVLYLAHIKHERVSDYVDAVKKHRTTWLSDKMASLLADNNIRKAQNYL